MVTTSQSTVSGCYNVTTTYVTTEVETGYTSTYSATSFVITGTTYSETGGTVTFPGGTFDCTYYPPSTITYNSTAFTITGTTFVENFSYTVTQTGYTTTETITSTYVTSG